VGRLSTVLLMVLSTLLALFLQNAVQLFNLLLVFGAGTGLIFILRWFWWRINAWSEIAAMVASGVISLLLAIPALHEFLFASAGGVFPPWFEFPFVVLVTSIIWLAVTFLTAAEKQEVLEGFYNKTQPGGPGWAKVLKKAGANSIQKEQVWSVPSGIIAMLLGCVMIYSTMFATGYYIYGRINLAVGLTFLALLSTFLLIRIWKKIKAKVF